MSNVPEHLEAELERQSRDSEFEKFNEQFEVDELGDEPFAESADEDNEK